MTINLLTLHTGCMLTLHTGSILIISLSHPKVDNVAAIYHKNVNHCTQPVQLQRHFYQ